MTCSTLAQSSAFCSQKTDYACTLRNEKRRTRIDGVRNDGDGGENSFTKTFCSYTFQLFIQQT